jgi:hypothetical protein
MRMEGLPLPEAALAAVIALAVVWATRRWVRSRPRAMKLFARDLVEHPDYYEREFVEHDRLVRAMDEAEAAPPPGRADFPRLIDDLLSRDRRRVNVAVIRLGKVAARAEDLLLAALDDPRATWTMDGAQAVDSAPAERVARLLAAIPSRALGDRIGHLADHPEWHVHRLAIQARVARGRAGDLPFALGKLAEQSDYAQEGVELALKRGWAEPAFIDGVRAWAERTVLDDSLPFSYWAVGFYAEHGGPAAVETLRSPRVLSVSNNRTVHAALDQINRRGVRVEPGVVRPLLDRALARPQPWPWMCVFEPALRALAASDPGAAARVAEDHFDRPESPFHRHAVDFLREAAGLPQPFAVEPPAGLELTADERGMLDAMWHCSVVYGEVNNGGLSQYFFNSTGGEWPRHVAALRAIGFEAGAAAVEEAARLIRPGGASLDRDRRIAEYAALSERQERRLDELSRLFSSDAPRVRFMLRHRELFARVRQAQAAAGRDTGRE